MALSKYFQNFHSLPLNGTMYVSVKSLHPEMANFDHKIYTHSIQAPFISKIGWLFQTHEHTDLCHLTEVLGGLLLHLNLSGTPIALGFQFEYI